MTDISKLAEWVGGILGVPAAYGEFPTVNGPAAMVVVGTGSLWVRRYVSGGGVARLPYEVYLRVPARTEGERLDGIVALRGLTERIAAGDAPFDYTDHIVTSLPSLYSSQDGGEAIYQTACELQYFSAE